MYFPLIFYRKTVFHLTLLALVGLKVSDGEMLRRGEYKIEVTESRACSKVGTNQIQFNWKLKKAGLDSKLLIGNVTLLRPLDDELTAKVYIQEWEAKKGWKPNYALVKEGACGALLVSLPELLSIIMTGGGKSKETAGYKPSCPIAKGVYMQTGFPADYLSYSRLPGAWPGRYKGSLSMLDTKKQLVGCYQMLITVSKKTS